MYFDNEKGYMKRVVLSLLFIYFLSVPVVLGADLTLDYNDITGDTYADENTPTVNWGSNVGLGVDSRSSKRQYTYINFDLTSVPDNSEITETVLCLTSAGLVNVAQRNITSHHEPLSTWDESTLTWNNKPSFNSTSEGNLTGDNSFFAVNSVHCIDITGAVNRSFDFNNVSIVLTETSGNSVGTSFYSSDYATASKRPYLNFTLASPNLVYGCVNITSSGNYIVNQTISADRDKCINITADGVTLDINGNTIDGNDYVSTIYIDNQLTGVEIHDVMIKDGVFTDGSTFIDVRNADSFNVSNNVFGDTAIGIYAENLGLENVLENNSFIVNNTFGNCTERCIDIHSGYYVGIQNNMFTSILPNGKNIVADLLENSTIELNKIGDLTVIGGICSVSNTPQVYWGWSWLPIGWGFNIRSVEETSCTSLTYNGNGAYSGVECSDCSYVYVIDNIIYATKDFLLTESSNNNQFAHNQFLYNPSIFNGCFWGTDTYSNYACGNEGNIIDSGTNNVIDASCSLVYTNETGVCNSGYFCQQDLSVEKLVYVDSSCSVVNETTCNCESNGDESYCSDTGDITTPQSSITSLLPIGTMFGVPALDILFTPFLILSVALVIGGVYAEKYATSGGKVFFIIILIGVLALTYFNIYPVWFGVLISIGVAGILVNMFNRVVG